MKSILEKLKLISNKKIRINGIGLFTCSIFYVYISVFIFLIGWIKPIFSIPSSIILIIALLEYWKKNRDKLKDTPPIYIKIKMLVSVCITIFFIGWFLGWAGFSGQTPDWWKHNSVSADLTNKQWPVYYNKFSESSMLTYYLGQYLFPALIGKLFSSINVTLVFNGVWAMFGLLFAILGIFKITKSDTTHKQITALIITFIFSTCLILVQFLGKLLLFEKSVATGTHYFVWDDDYTLQYSNNIVLLSWVMPQCIIPWIIFSILYDNKFDIKHYVILCLPMLLYSSLAFVGVIVILVFLALVHWLENKDVLGTLKQVFSISNISVCSTLGLILILYFSGNVFSEKPDNLAFHFVGYWGSNILVYILFVFSFLPYTLILFKNNKQNPFYWVATIILLVLPFIKLGMMNDFCMRASILPLFTYMLLSIDLLNNNTISSNRKTLLIIVLLIGSISSIPELKGAIESANTTFVVKDFSGSLEGCANKYADCTDDLKYNYYTYNLDDNFFYNYLAKEHKDKFKPNQKQTEYLYLKDTVS